MIWSKLKADSDYEDPCPIPLFIRDRARLKKGSNARQTQEDKAVHFAIR